MRSRLSLVVLAAAIVLGGCRSTYYGVMEKFGWEKRHLLADRIEDTQEAQEEATEQFQTVLERVKALTGFDGGDLEEMYRKLKSDYETAEKRADTVHERIESVQTVASDMFAEWQQEIEQISSPGLRAASREKLTATRSRYADMERAMVAAEARMAPVLVRLNDYVLFLKHNLNAQALGSLDSEIAGIETEVNRLIGDMQQSIRQAESFLATME